MAIALFDNGKDIYFYNLLAARKLKSIRRERDGYEKEIVNAIDSCGEILKKYGARCNYIERIHDIEQKMEPKGILPTSANREESNHVEQIGKLTDELTELIKSIPREASEDLEFYSKKIIDRRRRIDDTFKKEKELLDLYPDADKVDYQQIFNSLKSIFDKIRSFTGEEIEKRSIGDELGFPKQQKVMRISQASESILNLVRQKDYSAELTKPITTGLFEVVGEVFSEVNSNPKTSKSILEEKMPTIEPKAEINPVIEEEQKNEEPLVQEIKTDSVLDITEQDLNEPIKEEPVMIEETSVEPVITEETKEESIEEKKEVSEPIKEETVKEEEIVPEPVKEESTEIQAEAKEEEVDDPNLVTFEMPDEFTLADLAQAIDEPNWQDVYKAIYDANKGKFDKIIAEKNNGSIEGIEYNNKIFAGLTIKIPTIITQTKEEEKGLAKAA